MSENKMQESLTNVIAEGRSYKGFPVPYAPARAIWLDDFNSFLDRIEAAHKREVEKLNSVIQATVSRSDAEIDRLRREVAELRKQIGNAAKLREAVEAFVRAYELGDELANIEETSRAYEMAKAALAAPARNCDVGTPEEQYKRHEKLCDNTACIDCPVHEKFDFKQASCWSCQLVWAQMPYNESEAPNGK